MRSDVIRMEGKVFSYLTVISYSRKTPRNDLLWNVRCVCGTEKEIEGAHLRDGRTRSCGCKKNDMAYHSLGADLVGQVVGHLTVIERLDKRNVSGEFIWRCLCLCGLVKDASTGALTRGLTRSCGSGDCRKLLRKQQTVPVNRRARYLLKRYGLTEDDIRNMDVKQGYRCAICKKLKPLETDHCHTSKKVRGRLCGRCNRSIGLMDDSITNCLSAAKYLEGMTCVV